MPRSSVTPVQTVLVEYEPGSNVEKVIRCDAELERAAQRGDAAGVDALYAPEFVLNGPANQLQSREDTLELLSSGTGWFSKYERTIEAAYESGDVVVLMGGEVVVYEDFGSPVDGQSVRRRFTTAWRQIDGRWQQILRQATNFGSPRPV